MNDDERKHSMPFFFRKRSETNHLHPQNDDHRNAKDSVDVSMIEVSLPDDTDERIDEIMAVEAAPSSARPTRPVSSSSSDSYYYDTFWSMYSISVCAFLGAVLRAYLAHSLQCDDLSSSNAFCVTSAQTALFVDLPANLLGSFFLGILWQSQQVPHQSAIIPFGTAWQVGFCGSLTTCTYFVCVYGGYLSNNRSIDLPSHMFYSSSDCCMIISFFMEYANGHLAGTE